MALSVPAKSAQSDPSVERDASGVLLLPSHLFFVRSFDLPAGLSPEELPSFVELSLEQISPFALNQLYYGYYLPPEASHLLLFAAYRKQLAVYQDELWEAADLVLPEFACVLGLARKSPTLAFLQNGHEVTAVYWEADAETPSRVFSRMLNSESGSAHTERAYEELRRKIGPLPNHVTTLFLESSTQGEIRDRNLVFDLRKADGGEKLSTEIARPAYWSMDVRDKAFLQATRKVQQQNRWLWGGVMIMLAGFLALGIFEAALFAGRHILNTREARVMDLEPQVQMIMQEEELAMRLEELSGERLMPFEMLDAINEMRPPSIYFTRVATDGLRSFEAEARTPKSGDVDTFQRRLENADMLESVEIRGLRLRANDGQSSFNLAGTFREGALRKLSAASRNEEEAEEPAPAESEMEEPPAPEISDDRSPEERIPGRPPRPEMDLPNLPAREEEEYLEQPVVPLPHLSVGDVPVGEGAEDEIEREAGADPVPLPDLPVGDEPARADESMEEEEK